MAKVKNTMTEAKEDIPAETMKRIRVDEEVKKKVKKFWNEDVPEREQQLVDKAREDAIRIQEEQKKAIAIPADFIGPDKTQFHDPKANDADALIKKSN
jgi:hypothetical protein